MNRLQPLSTLDKLCDVLSLYVQLRARRQGLTLAAGWEEAKHPRAENGEFENSSGSSNNGPMQSTSQWLNAVDKAQQATMHAWAKKHDMSLPAYTRAVDDAVKATMALSQLYVRVNAKALGKILADGRFKTQFETNRASKGAALSTEGRAEFENKVWGIPVDADNASRPVYGYASDNGPVPGQLAEGALNAFGTVAVKLKPELKSHASVLFEDTVRTTDWGRQPNAAPMPMNEADHRALRIDSPDYFIPRDPLRTASTTNNAPYVEAQIHGGIRLSDIAHVHFLRGEPDDQLVNMLKSAGISWSKGKK